MGLCVKKSEVKENFLCIDVAGFYDFLEPLTDNHSRYYTVKKGLGVASVSVFGKFALISGCETYGINMTELSRKLSDMYVRDYMLSTNHTTHEALNFARRAVARIIQAAYPDLYDSEREVYDRLFVREDMSLLNADKAFEIDLDKITEK